MNDEAAILATLNAWADEPHDPIAVRMVRKVLFAVTASLQLAAMRPELTRQQGRQIQSLITDLQRLMPEEIAEISRLCDRMDLRPHQESEEAGLICAAGLLAMGFRCDESHGHPIYIREAVDAPEEWHTSLHLVPPGDGVYIAEIHNWQVVDGERLCDARQAVAVPRLIRSYDDLRRLCAVISDDWRDR